MEFLTEIADEVILGANSTPVQMIVQCEDEVTFSSGDYHSVIMTQEVEDEVTLTIGGLSSVSLIVEVEDDSDFNSASISTASMVVEVEDEILGSYVKSYAVSFTTEVEDDVLFSSTRISTASLITAVEDEVLSSSAKKYIVGLLTEVEDEVGISAKSGYSTAIITEVADEVTLQTRVSYSVSLTTEIEDEVKFSSGGFSRVTILTEIEDTCQNLSVEATTALMLALYGESLQGTFFTEYDYDSVTEVDGVFYGIKPTGIYELSGTLAVTPETLVKFHKQGNNYHKQLSHVYTADSSGVHVTLGGTTEDYVATSRGCANCSSRHHGKDLEITFDDFDELEAVEIMYYNLARRR